MSKKEMPKGFNCKNPKCKKWDDFGVYVYAHWNEELIHTCECGQQHRVKAGKVTRIPATWVTVK